MAYICNKILAHCVGFFQLVRHGIEALRQLSHFIRACYQHMLTVISAAYFLSYGIHFNKRRCNAVIQQQNKYNAETDNHNARYPKFTQYAKICVINAGIACMNSHYILKLSFYGGNTHCYGGCRLTVFVAVIHTGIYLARSYRFHCRSINIFAVFHSAGRASVILRKYTAVTVGYLQYGIMFLRYALQNAGIQQLLFRNPGLHKHLTY